MCDPGLRILLVIIWGQPIVIGPDKIFKEGPRFTRQVLKVLILLGRQAGFLPLLRYAYPPGYGRGNNPKD